MRSNNDESSERRVCAICAVGKYENAEQVARIPSNVRRWRHHLSTVWRCPRCLSLNSLEKPDLAPFYQDYPFSRRRLDFFTRRVFTGLLRQLRLLGLNPANSILDYGCSEGLLIRFLREQGYNNTFGYDAYSAPYSDPGVLRQKYDLIVCQDVIEHCEDPRGLLADLARYLEPGGVLYLGTPAADQIDLKNFRRSLHSLHQPYHLHILTKPTLRSLAEAANLTCVAIDYSDPCDTPYPFINRRFLNAYLEAGDGTLDAGFDPVKLRHILKLPKLLFLGLFGFWLPPVRSEIRAVFKKAVSNPSAHDRAAHASL